MFYHCFKNLLFILHLKKTTHIEMILPSYHHWDSVLIFRNNYWISRRSDYENLEDCVIK